MSYIQSLWSIMIDMSVWFMLGLVIAGMLHVWVRQSTVLQYVGKNNLRSVLWAAAVGVPLPLCSCGVIPTGVSLRKNGASRGATVSFLIATPQTGVDSIGITWSLLGGPFAVIRPFVALISGLIGGLVTNALVRDEKTESSIACATSRHEKGKSVLRIFRYAFGEFLEDISLWLVIGLLLSAAIAVFVPNDFFTTYVNNYWLSLLLILAVAVPLYVCATGSVPIAAVLIAKGLSPGAALVFLMAGPATNIATITVLAKTLGKKTTAIYVATIMVCAFIFALIIDHWMPSSWFALHGTAAEQCHTPTATVFDWLSIASAGIVSLLLLYHIMKKFVARFFGSPTLADGTQTIMVTDISCNKCKAKIEQHVAQAPGVETVVANVAQGTVTFSGSASKEYVSKIITDLGYTVKK